MRRHVWRVKFECAAYLDVDAYSLATLETPGYLHEEAFFPSLVLVYGQPACCTTTGNKDADSVVSDMQQLLSPEPPCVVVLIFVSFF